MRSLAIASCVGLMLFGIVLVVLDVRAALQYSGQMWTETMAQRLALWRWGVGCVIAGVLGMVALAFLNAILAARLWFGRQQERKDDA